MSTSPVNNLPSSPVGCPTNEGHLETHKKEKKDKDQGQPVDAILIAYMMIYESVIASHDTAAVQATQIEKNGEAQNNLIRNEQGFVIRTLDQDKMIKDAISELKVQNPGEYYILEQWMNGLPQDQQAGMKWLIDQMALKDPSVMQAVVGEFQSQNQEVIAIRGTFEDKLTVSRQTAQVAETNLNTTLNESSQSIQKGGSLMDTIYNLTNQIARI